MSRLIVEVCAVEEKAPIEGADRIERIRVKNWWCVAGKGHYQVGDKAVYVPPDSVLPRALAERWGIAKYCSAISQDNDGLRVRACRFRGVSSFGTIQDPDDPSWPVGLDVLAHYGISKYEPPVKTLDGDAEVSLPNFHTYTNIENLGNFPGVFADGDEVVVTEKLHGTNCRIGYICKGEENGEEIWGWAAGSHAVQRKEFDIKGNRSRYWLPLGEEDSLIRQMIHSIWFYEDATSAVIVFGEIFGPGVQDMHYGQKDLAFRVFDISVDGEYLDHESVEVYLGAFEISMVPILYQGPFSMAKINELVDGPTTICQPSDIKQPFKGREGIVIKPTKERFDGTVGGRAILKYISVDYHERKNKNATEDH